MHRSRELFFELQIHVPLKGLVLKLDSEVLTEINVPLSRKERIIQNALYRPNRSHRNSKTLLMWPGGESIMRCFQKLHPTWFCPGKWITGVMVPHVLIPVTSLLLQSFSEIICSSLLLLAGLVQPYISITALCPVSWQKILLNLACF